MFYLQAKVKGAQSSSLGLESPDPLERALFPVETRFSFLPCSTQKPGRPRATPWQSRLCAGVSHVYAHFSRPQTGTCGRMRMRGFMTTPQDGLSEAGAVALKRTGTGGVFWPWVLGPLGKGPWKCPSGSKLVFLFSGLNSKRPVGQERPCFLSMELLLPWKRPFWPTGPNNIPQSFQGL